MLLQPLVENAIVHGIAVKPGNGIVRISGSKVQ
jgi:sensor histidine kinase YesM